MQYSYCSLRDVIGRVVRNTRLNDSTYIADIHEWLYEAMDMLQTEHTLVKKCATLDMHFHKAKLPCGLVNIAGVEHRGKRLRENPSSRPAGTPVHSQYGYLQPSVFGTDIQKIEPLPNDPSVELYFTQLTQLNNQTYHENEYYYTEMGYMNTSFERGQIKLYYEAVPTDEDGFPQIPDNQNYKQALYWYCRAMMIGSGWEDKQFTYKECFEQWENIYAPRASAEIRLPSPEQMEHRIFTFVRFIPSDSYYDNFFRSDRREDFMDTKVW